MKTILEVRYVVHPPDNTFDNSFCFAHATVSIYGTAQHLRSTGVAVASLDDPAFAAEIKREELAQLCGILLACGFAPGAVDEAFQEV